jgi:uncharacterized protein YbjT (DUF2867 family)
MAKRVLLIGGTGLVGRLLAKALLDSGLRVDAITRRASGRGHSQWHEQVGPAAQWADVARRTGGDVAISALGTTMRAAGSQAAFRAVDFDLVLDFGRAARESEASHMILVSSVGADPSSRNFYLRLKGELERALEGLGFDRLDIIRPGLLRGERGGDRRGGERLGILISPLVNLLLRGRLARFSAIDARIVAAAMARLVDEESPGTFIHHNSDLYRIARG